MEWPPREPSDEPSMVPAQQSRGPGFAMASRTAAAMLDAGAGDEHRSQPQTTSSEADIDVLKEVGVALVEASDALPGGRSHGHRGAAQGVLIYRRTPIGRFANYEDSARR